MKPRYILMLLTVLAIHVAALSENIAYSYTNIINIKSQLAYTCMKIELYDSDMEPQHIRALRLVKSGTNDIMPDRNLELQFADGERIELTPLPGQMWSDVPYVWSGRNTTMPLRSMCYAINDEAYRKLTSSPLAAITVETINYRKKKEKVEEITIKPKDGAPLLEVLQHETEAIEKRQADMIQNWAPVSADFYESF